MRWLPGNRRPTGRSYHVDDSPVLANMAAAAGYVSVLVMALYINSPAVLELYTGPLRSGAFAWSCSIGLAG